MNHKSAVDNTADFLFDLFSRSSIIFLRDPRYEAEDTQVG